MHVSRRIHSTIGKRRGAALVAALALSTAFAPTVVAGGAIVTRGDFHEFNGYAAQITGRAQMVRTANGRTIVSIHVEGLEPGLTYAAHVHAAACGTGLADGHYRFVSGGDPTPPNEIWPGPVTANGGGIGNGDTVAVGTAGGTAVSVVVHAPGGAKIACADLG